MTEGTPHSIRLIEAPEHGVWRLGKAKEPLKYNQIAAEDADLPGGNRWSLVGRGALYCASEIEGCFGEALDPFRVDPELKAIAEEDWPQPYYMSPGTLPLDWRTRHTLVRLQPDKEARFLDIDDDETLHTLTLDLQHELAGFEVDKLTHDITQGPDRRITRTIAAWAVTQTAENGSPLIQGIAYRSRFAARQCWAIFAGVELHEVESQPVWPETEGLLAVARAYELTIR
ncbi:RES family NAD+ phosphorylase [Streptomyces sp. NPDC127168]|uniref:RES family NAD+ phosphorylase n=1 Tax=unclassified Streptomyces TaxID=2593676 RepID=UPI00362EE6E5